MKYRAKLDLDLSNGDIFEEEVITAMKAFAKTIAREAFQREIKEELVREATSYAKLLYDNRYFRSNLGDTIVKNAVREYIEERVSAKEVRDIIGKTTDSEIAKCQEHARQYVESQFQRCIADSFVTSAIQKEIEKAVPQAVLQCIMNPQKPAE